MYIYVLIFCQLEEEEGFKEFLSVHLNRSQALTWANDTAQETAGSESRQTKRKNKPASDDYLNFDSDESENEDEDYPEGDVDDEGWTTLFVFAHLNFTPVFQFLKNILKCVQTKSNTLLYKFFSNLEM